MYLKFFIELDASNVLRDNAIVLLEEKKVIKKYKREILSLLKSLYL